MELNNIKEVLEYFNALPERLYSKPYDSFTKEERYEASIPSQAIRMAEAIYKDMPFLAPAIAKILLTMDNLNGEINE